MLCASIYIRRVSPYRCVCVCVCVYVCMYTCVYIAAVYPARTNDPKRRRRSFTISSINPPSTTPSVIGTTASGYYRTRCAVRLKQTKKNIRVRKRI